MTTKDETKGEKDGQTAGKATADNGIVERGKATRFSGERAREAGRKSAQKRLEQAARATTADRDDVLSALLAAAKQGNVHAAREWLAHSTPTQQAGELEDVPFEEMDEQQRAFAKAYIEHRIARAGRIAQALRRDASPPAR